MKVLIYAVLAAASLLTPPTPPDPNPQKTACVAVCRADLLASYERLLQDLLNGDLDLADYLTLMETAEEDYDTCKANCAATHPNPINP